MNEIERLHAGEGLPVTIDPTGTLVSILSQPDKLESFPLDKLERLIELRDSMQASAAKQAFNAAFLAVQSELTAVPKRGYNKHTRARYVLVDDVVRMLNPILDRHGFSRSLTTKVGERAPGLAEGHTRFCLVLRHIDGHTEEHEADAPLDYTGKDGRTNKTMVQGMGSTYTYMQRYLLLNVFGIPIGDDDNDGQGSDVGPAADTISEDEARDLATLMVDLNVDKAKFLAFFKVAALPELTKEQHRKAVAILRQRQANHEPTDHNY